MEIARIHFRGGNPSPPPPLPRPGEGKPSPLVSSLLPVRTSSRASGKRRPGVGFPSRELRLLLPSTGVEGPGRWVTPPLPRGRERPRPAARAGDHGRPSPRRAAFSPAVGGDVRRAGKGRRKPGGSPAEGKVRRPQGGAAAAGSREPGPAGGGPLPQRMVTHSFMQLTPCFSSDKRRSLFDLASSTAGLCPRSIRSRATYIRWRTER